jgi:glycosyltransferase involved in cell wall biosynthesis
MSVLLKIPYIIYYRYDYALQVKNVNGRMLIGSYLCALERFAFKRVSGLWVTSPHLAELAKGFGRKKRIVVIPNWFDIDKVGRNDRSLPSSNSLGSHILFVGRLHKVKRVDLLLRAFSILHKSDPNMQLFIAGGDDGEEQNLVALANNLEISGNVHFLGYVNRETILDIISNSDLLVLPSKVEGNPRILIEAMILQVPIVATNVPGIRDMVQHMQTGYLVDGANPSKLAHAIEYVIKNPKVSNAFVERAYNFAKQNYSKEGAVQKIRQEIAVFVPKYSNRRSAS